MYKYGVDLNIYKYISDFLRYKFITIDMMKERISKKNYRDNHDGFGPIKYWNTKYIKDMSYLLQYKGDFNEDISRWNTSNVENMKGMFSFASFNQISVKK